MKRLLLIMAALAMLLCSCSGNSSFVVTEGADFHKIAAERSSDSERFELTAQESAEITVNVTVQANKGSVDILCSDSSAEIVSQYNDLKEGSYSFRLTGPDTFNIAVTCDGFTGSCDIVWETIGAVSTTEETPEVTVVDPQA